MKITKNQSLILIILFFSLTIGCHKDTETNKILDTLPVNTSISVLPAKAHQESILIQKNMAQILVPVINRLGETGLTFPNLSGPDGSLRYSFTVSENHYGTATFLIQFRDNINSVIDPITSLTSTTTLNNVLITFTGASDRFSYTGSWVLTLETSGTVTSTKRLTGTTTFTGSSYTINFSLPSPGITCTFEGLTRGTLSSTGTGGPSSTATSSLISFSTDHTSNGSLAWEGNSGGLHLNPNGTGFITTNQYLIPLQ